MNELKNKTVLVTGGAGFIGSHLCDELVGLGAKVICFDNFFTGKKENVLHLMDNNNFSLIEGDANKYEDLTKIFSQNKIDYIFHYAAVLGVKRVSANPLLVLPDIKGIEYVLKLAKKYHVKKVMFASSSEAYGFSANMPLKEDDDNLANNQNEHVHLYALVKLMGEKIMKVYNDIYGLPTCSLRFFNVFGPRQESSAYGFVTGVFIRQIMDNQPPTVFGDGYQTRDFIYISDNVRLGIKALLSPKTNGEVINIGVGRQTTIIDLAERLIRISGKNLKPKRLENRKYEIKYRAPDVSKMREILDEEIKDSLDENLAKTYGWYQKNN
ncbi:MAG: NAD-dependent epimerase/dehydratase family protein [Patescibacteria group bacterium]|nr:NAD-dependent epimerase/dehydratase family protein [Patescibacteria group bacterium]